MTGTHDNAKVSIPGNQMFIAFETASIVAKRGFKASILEIGIEYNNSYMKLFFGMSFVFCLY